MHPALAKICWAAAVTTVVVLLAWAAAILIVGRRETRPGSRSIFLLALCSALIVLLNFAAAGLIGIVVLHLSVDAIDAHRMTQDLYDLPAQASLLARILAVGGCLLGMATGIATAVVVIRQEPDVRFQRRAPEP